MAHLRASVDVFTSGYRTRLQQMSALRRKIKSFNLRNSYYNQLGLMYHDVLPYTPTVDEAVRRLPREERERRDFRISRAFHLSASKLVLPEDMWTTLEQDLPYLGPYVELIDKEKREKSEWDYFTNAELYDGE